MNDIKDVKAPIDMPGEWWWIWLAIAAVAALAAVLFFILRHKKILPEAPPVPPRPPAEIALEKLESLRLKNYLQQGMFKAYYIELSDILRHYLEDRFNFRAPEMTTEEFLESVKNATFLQGGHKQMLRDFLNGCDLVKFAKYQPDAAQAKEHFDLIKKLVMESRDGI